MKKITLTILMLFAIFAYGQKDYSVTFNQPKSDVYQLNFNVDNWNIQTVVHDGAQYKEIVFSQSTVTEKKGWAELPFISASIQLPPQKDVDLAIAHTEYVDYQLDFPLVPSRGVIYRNQDPASIPYEIHPESIIDAFYPSDLAIADNPFIIRDVRGTSVRVFPFQYNAVTNTLRVYNKIDVLLIENDNPATNPLLKENITPIKETIGMYQNMFLNFDKAKYNLSMAQYGEILVITTERDSETIDPYIQWKREKGYVVHKEVVEANHSGAQTKALIQNKYNENNNILYVQIIGDWAEIKSELGGGSNKPMDPKLGCVVGTDNFPDISIGRFSCSNADELNVQINKTINYEKTPNMDPDWHESFHAFAGREPGGDDGESDDIHISRIYSERLQSFTYNTVYENYQPNATVASVSAALNAGVSTLAYCAHGDTDGFYFNTGYGGSLYGFTNSNVNQLTNGDKLPFIIACACNTGEYNINGNCFAETWLKKENGGAIVVLMSSISQPWTPPMRGQDYFYDILIGGYDYAQNIGNGISTTEQRTTWGSIAVNAFNLMLSENSSYDDVCTVHTWGTFGDASLQLRTKQPNVITSSNNIILSGSDFETRITTTDGEPVANALVCISQNDVYVKGFTDEDGNISLEVPFEPDPVLLVVTAFNTTTIYETIDCIAPEGAYLKFISLSVDGDNQQLNYYDTAAYLKLTVKNVGVANAESATATISTDDPYVATISNSTTFPEVPAGSIVELSPAFTVSVASNVPDQHEITFNLVLSADNNVVEAQASLIVNAPKFIVNSTLLNDVENGNFIPGEITEIKLLISNEGHSDIKNGRLIPATTNQFVTIPNVPIYFGDLAVAETKEVVFFAHAAENIPEGELVKISLVFEGDYDFAIEESLDITYSDYCIPGKTDCNSGDKLVSFILGDINNNSTTCGNNGYSDFTDMKTVLTPGETYTVKVKCGYNNDRVRGWIDFNRDKIFSENEEAFLIACSTAETEYTATFTVPEDAVAGEQRLRVRVKKSADPDGPCEEWTYGQTHDYTVDISELFPKAENVVAGMIGNDVSLSWNAPSEARPSLVGYTIYRNNICLTNTPIKNSDLSYEDLNVPEGIYVYKIYVVYNEGISLPVSSPILVMFEAPTNLMLATDHENLSILVEWTATENAPIGYNVYRNEELLTDTPIVDTHFEDVNPIFDENCYSISAVYEYGESAQTKEKCEILSSIDDMTNTLFSIFPNPVANCINIVGNIAPQEIKIYNMTGQMIYNTTSCSQTMSIPLQISSGVYFLQINTGESTITKKIIVQ
ncbi:MAG: C25 family cysteine peptidase [Bacteroidales bacterium]|jgi:gingipain R|nr:C25 family cysteine peptidase [Bacteroidales bacterium]